MLEKESEQLNSELEKRAAWVRKTEQEFEERTAYARMLEKESEQLNSEPEKRAAWVRKTEQEFEERTAYARRLEKELVERNSWAMLLSRGKPRRLLRKLYNLIRR
jgi:flagellar motor protein MotB